MGFRFQKRINVLPGVRINLSKGGVSGSLGPRGADVNIGRNGVTTNAGIPGTGLSYRQKLGKPGRWIGIATIVAGLGLTAYKYHDKIGALFNQGPSAITTSGGSILPHIASPTAADTTVASATAASGTRFVKRNNSDLRAKPSTSSPAIVHEAKGAKVTLLAVSGKWSKVNDGKHEGWMRTSVLGEAAPNDE